MPKEQAPELSVQIERYIGVKRAAGRGDLYLKKLESHLNKYSQFIAADSSGSISVLLGRYNNLETRATMQATYSGFFAYAVRQGWLDKNPCADLDKPTIRRPEPCVLTVEQARELVGVIRKADPGLLCWLALALFCGVRRCELKRTPVNNLSATELVIPSAAAKTNRRRVVPIPPSARGMVSGGSIHPTNLRKRLEAVRRKLSFKLGKNCLRHSAASYLLALHQDAPKVALWLGHSVSVLFSHYHNARTRSEAKRFFRIPLDE